MFTRLKNLSLTTQITTLVVALVVLATAIVGSISYVFTRQAIERDAMRVVGLIANSRKEVLVAHLQNRKTRVSSMLRIAEKTCPPGPDVEASKACLQNILESFYKGTAAVQLQFHSPVLPTIELGNDPTSLANIAKPADSEIAHFGKDSSGQNVFVVDTKDQDTQAELIGLYPVQEVKEVFDKPFGLGRTGEVFLADSGGFALTLPQHHQPKEIQAAIAVPPMKACLNGDDGEMIADDDRGHPGVHGYRAVPELGGSCVTAHIDQSEAFEPAEQLQRAIVIGCAFFALFASLIGALAARLVLRPISKLARQAEALRNGDFSQSLTAEGPAELRACAQAFSSMAGKLVADLVEIKTSQNSLERSEERFRRAIIDAPYPILICTDDGEILQVNQALQTASGYTTEEIPTLLDWLQIVQPQDIDRALEQVALVADAATPQRLGEFEITPKGADKRIWSLSSAPLGKLDDGRGTMIIMAADLSDRRRADEAIRLSRERLDLVLRSVDVGLWYCDLPSRTLIWDEKMKEQFAVFNAGEMSIVESLQFVHPEDRERVSKSIEAAIGSHSIHDIEYRTLPIENRPSRWLRAIGKTFFDQEGRALRFDGISVDVTDKKLSEAVLRDQQMWLESVLNLLPIPLVLVAPRTARVLFSNDAATRLGVVVPRSLGMLDEEHSNSYFANAAGQPLSAEQSPIVRVANGEKFDAVEVQWHTGETTIPLLVFSEILPAMFGHSLTSILMFQDVTDLKAVENKLSKAVSSRDEFLATLSHELRTPLNVILGWIDILEVEKADPATVDKAIETLARNSMVLKELIDELLEVSRIISGKLEFKTKSLRLDTLVASAVSAFKPRAKEKSIKLAASIEDKAVIVDGDATRLTQVISNLLQNAIKFTDLGGKIAVSVTTDATRAIVTVKDNGIGISKNFLPFVFDRLQQENMGTTRSHGGLGLGLAITKHIVDRHNGRVRAESNGRGKGTSFIVEIPLFNGADAANSDLTNQQLTLEANAEAQPNQLHDLKVLVVDDSHDILSLVEKWLKDQGASVTTAISAKEAFDKLEGDRFDVLLSDIGMPEEDGYSFIDRVRGQKDKSYRQIPAGALTAYARAEERKQIIAAGFQLHVTKPVNKKTLISAVKELSGL